MNKNNILLFAAFLLSLSQISAQQGLMGEYYDGPNFERKVLTRIDHDIDFDWPLGVSPGPGIPPSQFSVRWTGKVFVPETGHYNFFSKVDDGIRLWIGNTLVIDAWGPHDSESFAGSIDLKGGQSYDLKVEFYNGILEGEIHLKWELPSEAPLLKGLLGHNDRKIDPKYFRQPVNTSELVAGNKPIVPPARSALKKQAPKAKKPVVNVNPPERPANLPDTIQKYTPRNILFEQSKSIMLQGSLAELDDLAGMLQRFPALHVSVEGHTDNMGDQVKNQKLSEERAAVVAAYLVHKGVQPERVSHKGFGSSRPLTSDHTPEGHARNRRVEFIIQ